ncbi:D-alanine-D-alanine ligase [Tangfeifania diversioriginum]|uniref:D-alanine--D-alanine ligase n=1 Tax=Tangfeifania diversioriginum TaxID=1168035 RepID=A0A1M6HUC5_9BACT|nr:D-alanine--D-alanine ligase [Tangfeifania diversioriginum]SHJ25826.1 D-alanine-D-alanine ligase [Tangfeifania diversioriginum]
MTEKPNIAVIAGGDSSEFVVSVKSGENVFNAIDTEKFTPWLVHMKGDNWHVIQDGNKLSDIDKSNFSFSQNGKKIKFDFAYITIHGTPGEDGILQGYFDLLKIPYSASHVQSSSLTFNKWFCNNYLQNFGVKMARSVILRKNETVNTSSIIKKLGLPVFVKPNAGGSSFGISKVKTEKEIIPALKKAWKESDDALIEEFIEGREYTCGLVKMKNKKLVFPVTEVIPKNEFFDFEAKYTPGATDEITPARLPEKLFKKCQEMSSEIYEWCQCSGIARIDYILKDNTFYFLEANTIPGMTATSFIPQQISAMGLTLKQVISQIIEEGLEK